MSRRRISDRSCPFLNSADRRCDEHLSLEALDQAFDVCLGTYKSCPVYDTIKAERKLRRTAMVLHNPMNSQLVQVTVERRSPLPAWKRLILAFLPKSRRNRAARTAETTSHAA